MNRIGVLAIVVEDLDSAMSLNEILHDYRHLVIGRMGLPLKERGISLLSVLIEGTTDDIGGLTGKIGALKGVTVKSALTKQH
ncbi:MAG: CopG family transcriptional regulator [delta proteobacterium ML8_F1]|nr:MAG: CopG family transcriptional regulator [delta proteobacterium ML8_F1]